MLFIQACSTKNPIQTSRITEKGKLVTGLGFDVASKSNETTISPVLSARLGLFNRVDIGGFANLMGIFGAIANGFDSQIQVTQGLYPSTFMLGFAYKDEPYISYQDDAENAPPQKSIYSGYVIGYKEIFVGFKMLYNLPENGNLILSDMFSAVPYTPGNWTKGLTLGYQNQKIDPSPILTLSFYKVGRWIAYVSYTFRWKF